jgi:hypothetical protein
VQHSSRLSLSLTHLCAVAYIQQPHTALGAISGPNRLSRA